MIVTVNGEERRMAAGTTLLELLESLGQDPRTVAVEHNGEVVPRGRHGDILLAEGDRLEIVRFVQGGLQAVLSGPRRLG